MAPALVLWHVEALPDSSATFALRFLGGQAHIGWGMDRHIAVATFNALQLNTEATGQYTKPPVLQRWPLPKTTNSTDEPKKPRSVKDLFFKLKK